MGLTAEKDTALLMAGVVTASTIAAGLATGAIFGPINGAETGVRAGILSAGIIGGFMLVAFSPERQRARDVMGNPSGPDTRPFLTKLWSNYGRIIGGAIAGGAAGSLFGFTIGLMGSPIHENLTTPIGAFLGGFGGFVGNQMSKLR